MTDDDSWVLDAVDRFETPLIRFAASLLGGDLDRARDVVQDTFLKLCRADRDAVDDHLAKWLFTVCRHRSLDVLRKERRMTTTDPSELHGGADDAPPDGELQLREATSKIWATLSELPDRQQQVLLLKFQDGLSYREMAERMDITVNHVGVLLHNAVKSLRARIGDPALLLPEA